MSSRQHAAACKLFVLLARNASRGVILRRGPATSTELIAWNTASDTFDAGQWFHGRIYERRCDLSPSGGKLIYFAAKHGLRTVDRSYNSTWTAVSKPPYFTAIALWPNGGTTYHGGGLFAAEDSIRVNSIDNRWSNQQRDRPPRVHPRHVPPAEVRVEPMTFTSGDQLLPLRLVRDGWKLTTPGNIHQDLDVQSGVLVRSLRGQPWDLRLDFDHKRLEYTLQPRRNAARKHPSPEGFDENPLENATWADWDKRRRLVFAREGKLFAIGPLVRGRFQIKVLADFNDHRPARMVAPVEASAW